MIQSRSSGVGFQNIVKDKALKKNENYGSRAEAGDKGSRSDIACCVAKYSKIKKMFYKDANGN